MPFKDRLKQVAREKLDTFMKQVAGLKPRAIILYGSYARNDFTEESDIDLCLVAERLPKDLPERRGLAGLYRVKGVRAIGHHPEEFLDELRRANTFIHEMLVEGVVLYDDDFVGEARRVQREVARQLGLVKRGKAWKSRIANR